MELVTGILPPGLWVWAIMVGLLAGVVKGLVGFAMPMILISGLGSIVSPDLALAGLILPTVVSNVWQAFRQGPRAAWDSVRRFRVFLAVGGVVLVLSAQLVRVLPGQVLLLGLGGLITVYAVLQLSGVPMTLPRTPTRKTEGLVGAVAGFIGGLSGVWGPPTVALLTAMETPKAEQMRVQGVIYGLGSVLLLSAHVVSGVLNRESLPLSLALVGPAVAGLFIGFAVQDRIDQSTFRKLTLAVLLIAGLNLIRRGVVGEGAGPEPNIWVTYGWRMADVGTLRLTGRVTRAAEPPRATPMSAVRD